MRRRSRRDWDSIVYRVSRLVLLDGKFSNLFSFSNPLHFTIRFPQPAAGSQTFVNMFGLTNTGKEDGRASLNNGYHWKLVLLTILLLLDVATLTTGDYEVIYV